jgi:hypothetical protein
VHGESSFATKLDFLSPPCFASGNRIACAIARWLCLNLVTRRGTFPAVENTLCMHYTLPRAHAAGCTPYDTPEHWRSGCTRRSASHNDFAPDQGLNLAKPKNSARGTLSDDPNCVGTLTKHSLFPGDHAVCSDFTVCSLGFCPPGCFKLRGKRFLRSFSPSRALLATSGRRADLYPIDFSLQSALTLPENRLSLD